MKFSSCTHLKVIIALRFVLVPSTQPLGKAALSGLPQLISVQDGWLPLHSLPASHVLNITDYIEETGVTVVMFSNDLITTRLPDIFINSLPRSIPHQHVAKVALILHHRLVADGSVDCLPIVGVTRDVTLDWEI